MRELLVELNFLFAEWERIIERELKSVNKRRYGSIVMILPSLDFTFHAKKFELLICIQQACGRVQEGINELILSYGLQPDSFDARSIPDKLPKQLLSKAFPGGMLSFGYLLWKCDPEHRKVIARTLLRVKEISLI
ncbi:hypothetical protein KKH43_05235 [Patescibacteria group bacterium]|nr:hypothetical protein [Patescibacteria group bacterium]